MKDFPLQHSALSVFHLVTITYPALQYVRPNFMLQVYTMVLPTSIWLVVQYFKIDLQALAFGHETVFTIEQIVQKQPRFCWGDSTQFLSYIMIGSQLSALYIICWRFECFSFLCQQTTSKKAVNFLNQRLVKHIVTLVQQLQSYIFFQGWASWGSIFAFIEINSPEEDLYIGQNMCNPLVPFYRVPDTKNSMKS